MVPAPTPGTARTRRAVHGHGSGTLRGARPRTAWSLAWRVARAAPSAPMARCMSPRALPAGSRASIRGRGAHDLRQRAAARRSRRLRWARWTSRSSAAPRTCWSRSSAPTSAAAMSSASTEWTARQLHRRRGHRRVRHGESAGRRLRRRRPASSTRCRAYRGGLLVTDGHHNRVLRVTLDGEISELIAFDNIVPTGLAVRGGTVYMAEAGPVPHLPEDGKVVSFGPRSTTVTRGGNRRPPARRCGVRARAHGCTPSPRVSSRRQP